MKKLLIIFSICCYCMPAKGQNVNTKTTTQTTARTNDTAKVTSKHIKTRMVCGGQMSSADDIIQNIDRSKDHTTFISAITASGFAETLKSRGPITVFAPTNDAFKKLAPGRLDTLLKPAHNVDLTRLLAYHVINEKVTSKNIAKKIAEGKGEAIFNTLSGSQLKAKINADRNIVLVDENGNEAVISIFDVEQNNGLIDVVNNLLIPKSK